MAREKPFVSVAGKWLAGIAGAVLTAVLVWLITSPDSPFRDGGHAAQAQWTKNWEQINQPVPFLGTSSGVRATNRAKYLARLEGLDLSTDTQLQPLKDHLISLSREASTHTDPFYDMLLTGPIEAAFENLKREVRNRAVDHGVDVGNR
jgi:hypothetical protein